MITICEECGWSWEPYGRPACRCRHGRGDAWVTTMAYTVEQLRELVPDGPGGP